MTPKCNWIDDKITTRGVKVCLMGIRVQSAKVSAVCVRLQIEFPFNENWFNWKHDASDLFAIFRVWLLPNDKSAYELFKHYFDFQSDLHLPLVTGCIAFVLCFVWISSPLDVDICTNGKWHSLKVRPQVHNLRLDATANYCWQPSGFKWHKSQPEMKEKSQQMLCSLEIISSHHEWRPQLDVSIVSHSLAYHHVFRVGCWLLVYQWMRCPIENVLHNKFLPTL